MVLQWRVGEGPSRSSCDLNNFQMEEEKEEVEIKGEEDEDLEKKMNNLKPGYW